MTKYLVSSFLALSLGVLLVSCKSGTGQNTNFVNTLPFQVQSSIPDYLATGVDLSTSEIFVHFTEPVDLSTINGNYKLVKTLGASSTDITNTITGVSPLQGGKVLVFQLTGTLTYNAGYTLTIYPGVISTIGNYLSYLTRVSFSTGPTDSFGYGEVLREGPPVVMGGNLPNPNGANDAEKNGTNGDLQMDLQCGCLTIYGYFSESLATPPVFRYEISNLFNFQVFGNPLVSGGTGQIPAYPIFTNNPTVWGVFMGCTQQNQAADRVLKMKVIPSSVYDLEGNQMKAPEKETTFHNPWFYSCP